MRNVGIYYAYWTSEWKTDFLPFVQKVKRLGFEQLEVHGGTIAEMAADDRRRLRIEAEEHQIALSYGIGLTPDRDVSSRDETVRRNGIAFMTRMIQAVGDMGGGMIGGTVHSYWPATPPSGLDEKARVRDQSLKSMRELVGIAADHNVVLNVEVINRFEQFLLNTAEEAVAYVREVDSPQCRILLDTFHLNIEEDSIGDAIRRVGDDLAELHLGETNRKPPGTGRMPWNEIKAALDDIGFEGPLVMEPFIRPGGQVGRDIGLWRDIMPNTDLDEEAARSAKFVKKNLR